MSSLRHAGDDLSDAGAHLTFFDDAGCGLHLLGHWARESGAMSMSQAVRRLTHQPAQIFGIQGRGLIRERYAADLLLFDPRTVGRGPQRRVFDLPGGAPRLTTDALGRAWRLGQWPPSGRWPGIDESGAVGGRIAEALFSLSGFLAGCP